MGHWRGGEGVRRKGGGRYEDTEGGAGMLGASGAVAKRAEAGRGFGVVV